MRVFTPGEIANHAANKYLGVLVAAKYARVLNEFPRDRSSSREKKLTTRALEELAKGEIEYHVVPRRRAEETLRCRRLRRSPSPLRGGSQYAAVRESSRAARHFRRHREVQSGVAPAPCHAQRRASPR